MEMNLALSEAKARDEGKNFIPVATRRPPLCITMNWYQCQSLEQ